jgi:hypothetical protein
MLYITGRHNNLGCMVNRYNELPCEPNNPGGMIDLFTTASASEHVKPGCSLLVVGDGFLTSAELNFPVPPRGQLVGSGSCMQRQALLPAAFAKTLKHSANLNSEGCRHYRAV